MFLQVLLPEGIAGLPSLQFDVLVLTAMALLNYSTSHQDTVWDVSNRICDRYFPKPNRA
jgi:hypothetical protein